jgi:hypothetical protein
VSAGWTINASLIARNVCQKEHRNERVSNSRVNRLKLSKIDEAEAEMIDRQDFRSDVSFVMLEITPTRRQPSWGTQLISTNRKTADGSSHGTSCTM